MIKKGRKFCDLHRTIWQNKNHNSSKMKLKVSEVQLAIGHTLTPAWREHTALKIKPMYAIHGYEKGRTPTCHLLIPASFTESSWYRGSKNNNNEERS